MRSAAALDFAETRGWNLSPSYIALGALVAGGRHAITRSRWVYRPSGWQCAAEYSLLSGDRRAAAIALHIRHWLEVEAGWCAAIKFGLVVELPNYPAWHSPSDCRLVLLIGPSGFRMRAPDLKTDALRSLATDQTSGYWWKRILRVTSGS
jgi:hypothetical protein